MVWISENAWVRLAAATVVMAQSPGRRARREGRRVSSRPRAR